MTVKELMQATGKSRDAVLKAIHDILPDKTILPRQKIVLEKDEIDKVLEILQQDYRILKEPAEKTSKMLTKVFLKKCLKRGFSPRCI